MPIDALVRPNIRAMQPYSSARSLHQTGMFFDANENALGSVVTVPKQDDLNRYPDPRSSALRAALATFLGVYQKNIFTGNGSDEVIDLLVRLFVNPDEHIMTLDPTYGLYTIAARIAGVAVESCLLDDEFQIDADAVLRSLTPKTKIIFCCSPNNPTGNLLRVEDIEVIAKQVNGIVVLDEAYVEFSSRPSLVTAVAHMDNVVVLRTFSKAWGLAGIRVGYAVANEQIIQYLDRIRPPYNINRISAGIAVAALAQQETMRTYRQIVLAERERMAERLRGLGVTVFPSEANFLLLRTPGASAIAQHLAAQGIIIRDFAGKPRLHDCVRITIATPEQNETLLTALSKLL